jgi:hypothetical protein
MAAIRYRARGHSDAYLHSCPACRLGHRCSGAERIGEACVGLPGYTGNVVERGLRHGLPHLLAA